MAKRELEEINAGSMADIAFLLLIFFLVTTTMEVDAGISRNLPFKRDLPIGYVPPKVHDRDILVIMANANDELLVENQFMLLEDLEEKVKDFYTANRNGETDPKMPGYMDINTVRCQQEIQNLNNLIAQEPNQETVNTIYKPELEKWEKRLDMCREIGSYKEISSQAVIQLKNQANTSYGLYIEIQNILKKVVNDLRVEESQERWGVNYFDLDPTAPADQEKLDMLQFLVPERIIESKIEI